MPSHLSKHLQKGTQDHDPANWDICDGHEAVFLKGQKCPDCLAEQGPQNKHTTPIDTYKISFASGKVLRGTVGSYKLSTDGLCRVTDDYGDDILFIMRNVDCVTIHTGDPDD